MGIVWITPVLVVAILIYVITYTLLRTSGDGRPALRRLFHPSGGGVQEEYGGTGHPDPKTKNTASKDDAS